jgi:hypothetical protein
MWTSFQEATLAASCSVSARPGEAHGYVAQALGRTSTTIKIWEKYGLFPQAPYLMNSKSISARRRLYPEDFIKSLKQIRDHGYIRQRMDRNVWQVFQREVLEALQRAVAPLNNREGCPSITGVNRNP